MEDEGKVPGKPPPPPQTTTTANKKLFLKNIKTTVSASDLTKKKPPTASAASAAMATGKRSRFKNRTEVSVENDPEARLPKFDPAGRSKYKHQVSCPDLLSRIGSVDPGKGEKMVELEDADGTHYMIVASRKSSTASKGSSGINVGGASTGMVSTESDDSKPGSANGETIRIFRRSRSGRPHSATRSESQQVSGGGAPAATWDPPFSPPSSAAGLLNNTGGGRDDDPGDEEDSSHCSSHLKTDEMPPPDTPAATKEAFLKLKQIVQRLRDRHRIEHETLVSNLEYVTDVVQAVALKTEEETEDDLSELQSDAVPDEVRKWLASTFAKQDQAPVRRSETRPTFKSVANAIRTGIFIERIYRRMSSSQLMVIPPEVQKALKCANDWTFDTFGLGQFCKGSPLRFMGYELLTRHGCLHKYKIPPTVLETMLVHVENGYAAHGNPYHNHMHACDVLQTVHYFISQTGLASWLSDLEIFTCLIAAIIHDYDHSGTTNNFHVNSGSSLAILYNDRAVLENHHISAFFRTLEHHDCNIFANMQKADFREFRNLCIEMVLHTDMTQHFSQLKAMKTVLQQHNGEPSFDKTKVLCLLLHSCDVSHPAKRWEVHHQWTSRCIEEFFMQGDRESELGLEYSPLCDRHNTMVPQSQIGFIDFIVAPTLTVLGDALEAILRSMEMANRKATRRIAEGQEGASLAEDEVEDIEEALLKRPWLEQLEVNRGKWQKKHDDGEQGIEPSGASKDLRPMSVTSITGKSRPTSAASSSVASSSGYQDNNNASGNTSSGEKLEPYQTRGPIAVSSDKILLDSCPPEGETKLSDVLETVPANIISPPGSPGAWDFAEKESSLKMEPPRPVSASMCSPPLPRKVPISVDHHLRK